AVSMEPFTMQQGRNCLKPASSSVAATSETCRSLASTAAQPAAADHEFTMRSATPLWPVWQQRGSHHGDAKAPHQSRHPSSAPVRRRTWSHDGDLINGASPSLGTARTPRPCEKPLLL